jgi:hypothetical protein
MPGLVHDYLRQATTGQLRSQIGSEDLERLHDDLRRSRQGTLSAISGSGLLLSGAILTGLDVGPWHWRGLSAIGLVALALGGWMLARAYRRYAA